MHGMVKIGHCNYSSWVVDMEELLERVVVDPNILVGKPVIRGTRIPVYLIVELMASGMNVGEVLREYPELKEEDVKAALLHASRLLEREITVGLQGLRSGLPLWAC